MKYVVEANETLCDVVSGWVGLGHRSGHVEEVEGVSVSVWGTPRP